MSAMMFLVTGRSTLCSTVCWGCHKKKHKSLCCWPFVMGIHRWLAHLSHKGPAMHKAFPVHVLWVELYIHPLVLFLLTKVLVLSSNFIPKSGPICYHRSHFRLPKMASSWPILASLWSWTTDVNWLHMAGPSFITENTASRETGSRDAYCNVVPVTHQWPLLLT